MTYIIGEEKWNKQVILSMIDDFLELYKKRPLVNNQGGMLSQHCLATYIFVKTLNPKYIIESGIFEGQSTWLLENTCPNSKIISIDPRLDYRKYISPTVEYKTEDWSLIDFSNIDISNTICFFDDHQNAVERIKSAVNRGFKYLIFEDNYPIGKGDCISLKQRLSINDETQEFLKKHIKIYYEFPPVFKNEYTRWGDLWDNNNYPTKEPIFDKLDSTNMNYKVFSDDAHNYTWIAYVELY